MQNSRTVLILEGLQLLLIHRTIRCAEINRALGDLLNSPAGTDRLVIDLKIRVLLVVLVKPLGVHGVRKRCARPVDRERAIRPQNTCEREDYRKHSSNSLHPYSPHVDLAVECAGVVLLFSCYRIVTIGTKLVKKSPGTCPEALQLIENYESPPYRITTRGNFALAGETSYSPRQEDPAWTGVRTCRRRQTAGASGSAPGQPRCAS